jgi:hypothetical protein
VDFDLGRVTDIAAAYIQGDNNDVFLLLGSEDGSRFAPLWTADRVDGPGMRSRDKLGLGGRARYLRLSARGGDRHVSAAELQVFAKAPDPWPPALPQHLGARPLPHHTATIIIWGILACLAVLLHRTTWPRSRQVMVWSIPVAATAYAVWLLADAWPVDPQLMPLLRLTLAMVAAAAVVRWAWLGRDMHRRATTAVLWTTAILAVLCFYNLGHPQFQHDAEQRRLFVHTWDMRVYFPTAKYFKELGYGGVYLASLKAYLEEHNLPDDALPTLRLRNLDNYDMVLAGDVVADMRAMKQRFAPERWSEFKTDMAWFQQAMGPGYLDSLTDHGANATPAWMLAAYMLFRDVNAGEGVLFIAGLLDVGLLLLFLLAAARAFGLQTALVCVTLWGTTSLPYFGSCWAGATLRHDWMFYLGLGVCALKRERWATGGALLGASAMIRVFPAFALIFLSVPLLWRLCDRRLRVGEPPVPLKGLLTRPFLRITAGAAGCALVLTLGSSAVFGFSRSWVPWVQKIANHADNPSVNNVGLRTLAAFDVSPEQRTRVIAGATDPWTPWQDSYHDTLARRRPWHWLCLALLTGLGVLACRGRRFDQAALVGMLLMPMWLYPSNYYLHYVFVLPLLAPLMLGRSEEAAAERSQWGGICLVLLGMCVFEYFGFSIERTDERYAFWSIGIVGGFASILAVLAWPSLRAWRLARLDATEP